MEIRPQPHRFAHSAAENLIDLLRHRAAQCAPQVAYLFLDDAAAPQPHRTYGELNRRACAIGAALQAMGAAHQPVLLPYQPGPAYIEALFGCLYAGAVAVPVYAAAWLQQAARATGARLMLAAGPLAIQIPLLQVVTTDEIGADWEAQWQPPLIGPDAPALIFCCATGDALAHQTYRHGDLLAALRAGTDTPCGVMAGEDGRLLSWLPPYHLTGLLGSLLLPLERGTEALLMRPSTFWQQPLHWLPAAAATAHPLSHGQQALWFLHKLTPQSGAYHVAHAACIRAAVDLPAFELALQLLTARHAALRTLLAEADGQAVQKVYASLPALFAQRDLTGCSRAELDERLSEEAWRPFDLTQEPPLRAALLSRGPDEHYLVLTMHHILTDFWSMAVLVRDLGACYAAALEGRPPALGELPLRYVEVVAQQREALAGAEGERHWRYWQQQLAGELPVLDLPLDRARPAVRSERGGAARLTLSSNVTQALKRMARRQGATIYVTLLTAFQTLLARYSGQEEIIVGSPIAARSRETAGLIGYLVSPLPMRARLAGNPTFASLLAQVKQRVREAAAHRQYPLQLLVDRLQLPHDGSRTPLFQVAYTHQPAHLAGEGSLAPFALGIERYRARMGPLPLESVAIPQRFAQFDLSLFSAEVGDELALVCQYCPDLFTHERMQRLLQHLSVLLAAVADDPEMRIGELPLLTQAEREQLLVEWNDTAVEYPSDLCAHELFEQQAARTPDVVAVVYEGEQLTYGELNRRTNQLAHYLRQRGVGPEVLVGLCLERSPEMVMAILAVVKAGGAYLPLDPDYPAERLTYMTQDAQIPMLITQQRLRHLLPAYDGVTLCLDTDWGRVAAESAANLPCVVTGKSLAYVIYTSGSTGRPKGVQIEHGSLYNLTMTMVEIFGLGVETRKLQFGNFSSDLSVMECFTALARGATLIMAPSEVMRDTDALVELLARERVTLANFTSTSLVAQFPLDAAPALQMLATGAEPFPAPIAAQWRRRVPYLNLYGPTEVTVLATIWEAPERFDETRPLPIGRPVANYRTYILDAQMQPVPVGVPGEIYIGGAGVGRGYLNRPGLTAERFVPDPYSALPGARLYRTGDLGQWLPDGNIAFLGRVDQQVKIRGFRVETGEIEVALVSHPAVKDAVVLAREDQPGLKRLVAYLTAASEQRPNVAELRTYLTERLPDYMIPARFMVLDAFPLNPNGKVDKRALPVPEEGALVGAGYVAPKTPVEEVLAAIWAEVLGSKRISTDENFFELGGHSLLATQVMSRLRKALAIDLPLRHLFEAPTVAALAERVEAAVRAAHGAAAPPLGLMERPIELPLSFAQQRLWFLDQLSAGHEPDDRSLRPGDTAYHIPIAIRLIGPLDENALEQSLSEIIRRHESLRTTFGSVEGRPVQLVQPAAALRLDVQDVEAADVEALARAEAQRPFDLSRDLMLRARLLRLAEGEHMLLLTMHHIAADGWSLGVLIREVAALYSAYATATPSTLPELPVQYADYALWQRNWLQGAALQRQTAYWRERLAGLPVLALPTDRPRPAVQRTAGAAHPVQIPLPLVQALKLLGQQEGASLFMTLLATFQILLSRYSGQEDLPVGMPIANRSPAETEGLIGFFVNTLVMRADLSGRPTFRELLQRVRGRALEAYQHQDLPFEELVSLLRPDRSLAYHPLFQVMLNLVNTPREPVQLPGLTLHPVPISHEESKFDLSLNLYEDAGTLVGAMWYNTDLFDRSSIARMCGHLLTLLEAAVAQPDAPIADLPLLDAAERAQLLGEWIDTAADYPHEQTIHELFEQQVARAPEAVALISGEQRFTYGELNREANRIAHWLQQRGVGPEVRVGVCLQRSRQWVAALLGVLKAGGVYLPMEPAHPPQRLAEMLIDAGAAVLLTVGSSATLLRDAFGQGGPEIICLDEEQDALQQQSDANLQSGAGSENLATLFYTSGSTGRPKGVQATHRGNVNYLHDMIRRYQIGPADTVLQMAAIPFDPSIRDTIGPLLAGARLLLLQHMETVDAQAVMAQIRQQRVTCIPSIVPTLLRPLLSAIEESGQPCDSLRLLMPCGEMLFYSDCRRAQWAFPRALQVNQYGPTECTMVSASYVVEALKADGQAVPVGVPISNAQIYLLDRHLAPVPVGVTGELYIGGVGVARAYQGKPEMTAERFLPNPFARSPLDAAREQGARMYRTGDLGRWTATGRLELLGRADNQVKLRGVRVELGELEEALRQHPAVREAAVAVRDGDLLIAYLVAAALPHPSGSELQRHLRQRLPGYMIPGQIAWLESLPHTATGKIDRGALPEPDDLALPQQGEYVAARTPIEELLAGIWAEVLRLAQVGIHENFFEIGGHSLLATQVMSRLRKALDIDLPLRHLFEAPTVAFLAERVEASLRAAQGSSVPPLGPMQRPIELPLSFAQQRLWFLDQLRPGDTAYLIPAAVRLRGPLDVGALERSFDEIIRRHESLRTTFASVDGRPVQAVKPSCAFHLPLLQADASAIEALAQAEAQRPFDLSRDLMLRARLLQVAAEEHVLLLTMHHIAADGWSMGVLIREVAALYGAFAAGEEPQLPAPPIQYADFALWQRQWLQGAVLERQLSYWKAQLDGVALLELPTDRPRSAMLSNRGSSLSFSIAADLTQALHRFSQQEGATLFMTLMAAFQVLLHRYSGQDDIAVGTPTANRNRVEIEGLIGFFVNMLVMRADLSGEPTFRQLLAQVRERALGAYLHQEVPFDMLVEALQPERSLSHAPLFQVGLTLQNAPTTAISLPALTLERITADVGYAKLDLDLYFSDTGEGLNGTLVYNTDLFTVETAQRISGHLVVLLCAIIAAPDQSVALLPLMTEAEEQERRHWNDTERAYDLQTCIHLLVEQQVERTPERIALVYEGCTLTYEALNRRANRLAHYLRRRGVGPDVLVAICADRSLEITVGLLAILKAGGAYVPIDPAYPPDRIAYMLADSRATMLLTQSHVAAQMPAHGAEMVLLDTAAAELGEESDANPVNLTRPDNLAYMIYTSGSTGKPKGAMNDHRNICCRLFSMQEYFQLDESSRVLQNTAFSFDVSVWEFFWPLVVGARLVMERPGGHQDSRYLVQLIQQEAVTTLHFVPAMLQLFLEEPGAERCSSLQHVLAGGEGVTYELQKRFYERLADAPATLYHLYGPTETAIAVTCWVCDRQAPTQVVPIGTPVANSQIHILDRHLQPVPVGVPGELYIGGTQVGRGYWQRPDLTAERFVPDPFHAVAGLRMYRSGDLARFRADGAIEFLGRIDHQVKVRGFRIELGEIETALEKHEAVREVVVLARESRRGGLQAASIKQLIAYLVPKAGQQLTVAEVRAYLRDQLPDYMVPTAFVILAAMPLNPSGKVDRKALPDPEHSTDETTYVAPRDQLEWQLAQIWEEVLNLRPVGIHDNFFAIGGHSLLVVRLAALTRQMTGQQIPLDLFYRSGTIEQLAIALRQQGSLPSPQPILRLKGGAHEQPLFLVHEVSGSVLGYTDLAYALQTDRPIYGLQAVGLEGEAEPLTEVAAMASRYLEAIRTVQAQGPYYLSGYSLGGILAFEMAQQLAQRGEQVALLALVDSTTLTTRMAEIDANVAAIVAEQLQVALPPDQRRLSFEEQVAWLIAEAKATGRLTSALGTDQAWNWIRVVRANVHAVQRYQMNRYAGNAVVILADQARDGLHEEQRAFWTQWVAGELQVEVTPGDHQGIIQPPHVQELAARLSRLLDG